MPRPRLYYRVCEILSINRVGMEIISTSWIACNERPARLFRLIDFGDATSGWRNNIPNGFVNVIIIGRSRTIRSRYVNLEREREREKLFVRFEDLYISENNWMHNLKIKKNLEVTLEMWSLNIYLGKEFKDQRRKISKVKLILARLGVLWTRTRQIAREFPRFGLISSEL